MRIVCSIVIGLLLTECSDERQTASGGDFQRGDAIIVALEKYRTDHGTYPDTLDALVPKYLPAVQEPDYGERRWVYITYNEKGAYGLFMWRRDKVGYGFNVPEPKWVYIDNSF